MWEECCSLKQNVQVVGGSSPKIINEVCRVTGKVQLHTTKDGKQNIVLTCMKPVQNNNINKWIIILFCLKSISSLKVKVNVNKSEFRGDQIPIL